MVCIRKGGAGGGGGREEGCCSVSHTYLSVCTCSSAVCLINGVSQRRDISTFLLNLIHLCVRVRVRVRVRVCARACVRDFVCCLGVLQMRVDVFWSGMSD